MFIKFIINNLLFDSVIIYNFSSFNLLNRHEANTSKKLFIIYLFGNTNSKKSNIFLKSCISVDNSINFLYDKFVLNKIKSLRIPSLNNLFSKSYTPFF